MEVLSTIRVVEPPLRHEGGRVSSGGGEADPQRTPRKVGAERSRRAFPSDLLNFRLAQVSVRCTTARVQRTK